MPEYMNTSWLLDLVMDIELDNDSMDEAIMEGECNPKSDRLYWNLVKCYHNEEDMNN
jgi:hypothetical protein